MACCCSWLGSAAIERLLHGGVGEPLALHGHGVALLRDVAALLEELQGIVARVDCQLCRATAKGELFQRIAQHRRYALPRDARMHIEHVDMVRAFQRGKADRRILQRGDQRQFAGQPRAECRLVVGGAGPSLLLRFAVVVAGQLLDRRDEDRGENRRIGREVRPQRGFWQCLSHQRATSQVVPSLESLIAIPIAASSSRIRSDSLKSFRARAAVRAEIRLSICSASTPLALRPSHCAAVSERNPRSRREAAKSLRSPSFAAAPFRKPCSEAIICGVLRSSESASITVPAGCPAWISAATRYQSSSVLALSSNPFSVQSIGER